MTKSRFRTQFNPKYKGTEGETNDEQSMTVPDDNLSLRQLLINNSRNIGTNQVIHKGVYTGNQLVPNDLDIVDRKERQEQLIEDAKKLKKKIKQETDEKKVKKEEKQQQSGKTTDIKKQEDDKSSKQSDGNATV